MDQLTSDQRITPFQSEAFLDLALNKWLIATPRPEAALQQLARLLVLHHNDRWLLDLLASESSPMAFESFLKARAANRTGDSDEAIRSADIAIDLFVQSHNLPGTLRAGFERVYALRRKSRGNECEKESGRLSRLARPASYSWLQTQILLERSSCLAMDGKFDMAWNTAMNAQRVAAHAGYRSLQLRAVGMEASLHTNEGRLDRAWTTTARGLHLFFAEAFPPERGFQFYSELEFAAEEAEQWHLAVMLQKEAISYIQAQGRHDFEATAHFHLAAAEVALGDAPGARTEIEAGQEAFHRLPQGSSRAFLEAESKIALAGMEAKFGSPTAAKDYLSGLDEIVSKAENFTIQLSYEQAQADIQKALGDHAEESLHLKRLVSIGNTGFASLESPRDRWEWEHTVGQAYRRLLEIKLDDSHDPLKALADWESYRSTTSSNKRRLLPSLGATKVDQQFLIEQTKTLHDSSVIVFAGLPEKWVAWIADDRGIRQVTLPVSKSELASLTKAFLLLCSNPASSVQKVKSTGLRLYELLLAPLDQEIRLRNTLYIESDGILGMVPWTALTTPDGTYLGTRFAIVNVPGLAVSPAASQAERANQFLVAYPGAVSLAGELYPPLPGAQEEATRLATSQKNSVYLTNKQVTTSNLANALPHASQFHFAGHAVTREFGGELLVQGPDGGELLSASTISSLDLSRLRLAVLAACSTGTTLEASRNPHGLVGAFIQAGTHRVIASTWAVDSQATSGLMSRFYSLLRRNRDKGSTEAAWLEAVIPASVSHPYYWAGFQVFGLLS
ncbi:MAG TPA: CHAT domain-containing protein [Candidatus Angelobacter sp.]